MQEAAFAMHHGRCLNWNDVTRNKHLVVHGGHSAPCVICSWFAPSREPACTRQWQDLIVAIAIGVTPRQDQMAAGDAGEPVGRPHDSPCVAATARNSWIMEEDRNAMGAAYTFCCAIRSHQR